MPIDFLGKEPKKKIKKEEYSPEPEMHMPAKETRKKRQAERRRKKSEAKKEVPKKVFREVNLITYFKQRLLKRRLTFIIISVIIIIGGIFSYFYFFYQPVSLVVVNKNINKPSEPSPKPTVSPAPSSALSPQPPAEPAPLPDTPLAPLRGAVVKFSGETTLYLVEDNGELRKIDRQTVFFENGESINEISPNLIYTIADRFKDVRKGKDVIGQVDWDPRVLSFQKLAPFLR